MKIGIICNHIFGLQSISYLHQQGVIAGLAIHEGENSVILQIRQLAGFSKIPLAVVNKKNYVNALKEWINKIQPDVVLVYSFSYKIPQEIIDIPPLGIINFHPGNLPDYRGPDPIFWQIRNGLRETVVTAHLMSKELDAGPVLSREKGLIDDNDTYGIMEIKYGFTALRCTGNIMRIITQLDINAIKEEQNQNNASFLKRPTELDMTINWKEQTALSIKNLVRACNPRYQGAITYFRSFPLRILQVSIDETTETKEIPGTIILINDSGIIVSTKDNKSMIIEVIYVQEGCFNGNLFGKIFSVMAGEKFTRYLI